MADPRGFKATVFITLAMLLLLVIDSIHDLPSWILWLNLILAGSMVSTKVNNHTLDLTLPFTIIGIYGGLELRWLVVLLLIKYLWLTTPRVTLFYVITSILIAGYGIEMISIFNTIGILLIGVPLVFLQPNYQIPRLDSKQNPKF